jgi:Ser/Thr protein kinase RdoA (MazF antagonist)
VFRVNFDNDVAIVARIFPGEDALRVAVRLCSILQHLQAHDYPAERPAVAVVHAVSKLDPALPVGAVLATNFVPGARPERNRATFHKLGQLLGRLHALPVPEGQSKGGAWHHLSLLGGIDEECEAAVRMLDAAEQGDDNAAGDVTQLRDAVRHVQSAFAAEEANLPQAIVHPDLVPVNVIAHEEGGGGDEWTVVDWAGSGAGPRILSLGFLLGVGAIRGKLVLPQAVMKGYAAHASRLEAAELRVLREAAYARFLTMSCWEVGVGRKKPAEAVKGLDGLLAMADQVATKVTEYFESLKRE